MSRANSKPYQIAHSDILGRYLVTTRDVKAGEVILKESPLLIGPRVDSDVICVGCYSPLSLVKYYRCSRCRVAPLCNVVCEKAGEHSQVECDAFIHAKNANASVIDLVNNYQVLLPLRCLHLRDIAPEKWAALTTLEAHMEERRDAPIWRSHQETVVKILDAWGLLPSEADIDEVVQRVCGVLDVNSFEVRGPLAVAIPRPSEILRGIYLEAALMAHDCVGNTHLAVDSNFQMTIHASVAIPASQPIYFNYTSTMQGTEQRQEHLREGKYFECSCPRCSDATELGTHMSSLRCTRCHVGLVGRSSLKNWSCGQCLHTYRTEMISATLSVARQELSDVDKCCPKDIEAMMKKFSRTFHPNHDILLELKQHLVALYRDVILREPSPGRKILLRKMELCKELLPVLAIIEPGISRLRGITLYELHVPVVLLANREFQIGEITSNEFLSRLSEAEKYLREAVTQLLYEPTHTPENQLARVAMQELKGLRKTIQDAEMMNEIDKGSNGTRKSGKRNKGKPK